MYLGNATYDLRVDGIPEQKVGEKEGRNTRWKKFEGRKHTYGKGDLLIDLDLDECEVRHETEKRVRVMKSYLSIFVRKIYIEYHSFFIIIIYTDTIDFILSN